MILSQRTYIEKLFQRFGMQHCSPSKTPMEVKPPDRDVTLPTIINDKLYRELIGCLMHLMLATRPDICYAVAYHSRFRSDANETDWKSLKLILKYLQAFTDTDWGNSVDRKSTSGFVVKIFGATVPWGSRKQRVTALSSTEAEFVALATASCEVMWLKTLFDEMKIDSQIPNTYEDNQSCIRSVSA
ncbi:hypothetical protein ILUMI_16596 [Ignelater luminosus]|uniref:Polyprotein n=1 Tax=Ignelater luminosus TaxID=2038154 RepID=A0A8K0CQQ8_IGNLU|nr:hypothetical protein ILUMI_16596 [Ignelater luminosus]